MVGGEKASELGGRLPLDAKGGWTPLAGSFCKFAVLTLSRLY